MVGWSVGWLGENGLTSRSTMKKKMQKKKEKEKNQKAGKLNEKCEMRNAKVKYKITK